MEIYTNSAVRKAYLDVPVTPTAISVSIRDDAGVELNQPSTVTLEPDGRYSIVIPYSLVRTDRNMTVEWSFSYQEDGSDYTGTLVTDVEVVSPILPIKFIRTMFQPDSTDEEILGVEAAVRHIINAHTGQSFGNFVGRKIVRGDGNASLALPARLMKLTDVNGDTDISNYEILGDGFYLKYYQFGVPPVKADYYGLHMHTGGVIHNPNAVSIPSFAPQAYVVNGTWGYSEVPPQVQEAAKLLVYDYATQEVQYRDRYLTSMTAADWRIQFNSGAFMRTGNVRADQLLDDYVLKRGWAVL